jgi:Na+/H+ antiporter NhaD/arsenite permease-like protein
MAAIASVVFLLTYAGVAMGRYPRLAIDRTGFALLGGMAMVVFGVLTPEQATGAVHLPTLLLLYGLMLVSAQLRLGGFYTWLAQRIVAWAVVPKRFLLMLMLVSGLLSSFLANDIICLAFTPVVAVGLLRRGLNPVPYLLGLAMATNLGSASTIIGNPQTMLVGQVAELSFADYLLWCAPPSVAALLLTYVVLVRIYGPSLMLVGEGVDLAAGADWPKFDRWQSVKGLLAAGIVVGLMFAPIPREWSVLAVGAMLLMSRRMHTRTVLGIVDWHLITMFAGLFVVVAGLSATGLPHRLVEGLAASGVELGNPYLLTLVTMALSNLVSNVPATMLMIPHIGGDSPVPWYVLSLAATYAGNLLTIGSMANLIVIEQARQQGVRISFWEYARTGIVVTAVNLLVLMGWIWLRT